MYDLNLTPDHPIYLPLSADARLGPTDYTNDHIWELNLGNSEPPAISLQTTFGLRARFCRIFPRFIFNGQIISDPARFHHPVTIHQYFANYINLSFKPFSCINVILEYWVPDSHVIACRTKIFNISHEACQIQIDWAELLLPVLEGNRMTPKEIGLSTILAGETANLAPVLFLTGGAKADNSPYPSLNLSSVIPRNGVQVNQWVHASLSEINASFQLAKDVSNKNWDRECAQIARINSQRLEIITGNQDWNTAFYIVQTVADQLFLQPTHLCKAPSFVSARNPDQGYSLLNDGSDYNYFWNGQSPLDSYYFTNFILPSSPDFLKGLLDNFLATQTTQGEIDLKPGLGGQRSQLLATPLLATMTWRYYKYTDDVEYIKTIFPNLLLFFFSWFSNIHDRDNDFIPEWDQTVQTGFEEHPLFSYSDHLSGGVEVSTVESPDLCSFLYQECQSLISISKQIGNDEAINQLESIAEKLKITVEQSWSDSQACFSYRDRDSHLSTPPYYLGELNASGVIEVQQEFPYPVRPIIYIKSRKEGTRPVQVYIHGRSTNGTHRVDHISAYQIHWHLNSGYFTSEYIYKIIEQIEITGLLPGDKVIVQTPCLTFRDQTLLLPLWAGLASEEKAKKLLRLTVMNKKGFLSPYGIRSYIDFQYLSEIPEEHPTINFLWESLILDGMLRYGERKKAAEIFTRTMKAVVHSLNANMTFHKYYHSESGKPLGATNSLTSLVPVGLFLNILGVNIINSSKVEIIGNNPFPWPVTIKFRGLTIVQQEKKTLVIFADGQNITIDSNQPQIINLSEEK
jgi:hypothetical protein